MQCSVLQCHVMWCNRSVNACTVYIQNVSLLPSNQHFMADSFGFHLAPWDFRFQLVSRLSCGKTSGDLYSSPAWCNADRRLERCFVFALVATARAGAAFLGEMFSLKNWNNQILHVLPACVSYTCIDIQSLVVVIYKPTYFIVSDRTLDFISSKILLCKSS